jgi:hypothetical protein
MVKGYTLEASLDSVRDYDGNLFIDQKTQREFIRQHFAESFRKPQVELADHQGCIERFLGEEILTHPLVTNLKLSEHEKNSL